PTVRKAALRRAADLDLTRERMHEDADPKLREAARKLFFDLLDGRHPQAPALARRQQMLSELDDAAVLEHVACHAEETPLREAALHKLGRPALNLQRLLQDPDPELRLRLLAGVEDAATLER